MHSETGQFTISAFLYITTRVPNHSPTLYNHTECILEQLFEMKCLKHTDCRMVASNISGRSRTKVVLRLISRLVRCLLNLLFEVSLIFQESQPVPKGDLLSCSF